MSSKDYHDYVIKDGKFIGEFEKMYQKISDPWGCVAKNNSLGNDILLMLIKQYIENNKKTCSLFEVGCGLGGVTKRIIEILPDAKIYACDVSSSAITYAQANIPGANFFVCDVMQQDNIFFEDNSLDVIVLSQVIFYILPKLQNILSMFHRILNNGGTLIVQQTFLKSADQKYGNEIFATTNDLKRELKKVGFEIQTQIDQNPRDELFRPQNCLILALKNR